MSVPAFLHHSLCQFEKISFRLPGSAQKPPSLQPEEEQVSG